MPPNRVIPKDALQAGYTYPKGRLLPSCFALAKISGFQKAKTSANKRFLYVCKLMFAGAKVLHFFELCKYAHKNIVIYAKKHK